MKRTLCLLVILPLITLVMAEPTSNSLAFKLEALADAIVHATQYGLISRRVSHIAAWKVLSLIQDLLCRDLITEEEANEIRIRLRYLWFRQPDPPGQLMVRLMKFALSCLLDDLLRDLESEVPEELKQDVEELRSLLLWDLRAVIYAFPPSPPQPYITYP